MRVAILSRSRQLYSTRRLLEACRAEGLDAQVFDPLDLFLLVGPEGARLFHRTSARPLRGLDLTLPRIGATLTDHGLGVLRQLEGMGVPAVNRAESIALARDKMRSLQWLSQHGIATPRTAMVRHPGQLPLALRQIGGPPVVAKLVSGTQGIGVILLETADAVEGVLDTLWSLGQSILLQEFVRESRGRDVRALVVGDRVVAAMRRQARAGEFRANIHRGGTGTKVELDAVALEAAVSAVGCLGLDVAGVDLLETGAGPRVLEVNPSPGLQGIEGATEVDVAGAIVRHSRTIVAARGARPAGRASSVAEAEPSDRTPGRRR